MIRVLTVLFLCVFGLQVLNAQTAVNSEHTVYQWGLEFIIDPNSEIGNRRLLYQDPMEIYQEGELIGVAEQGKDCRYIIRLNQAQIEKRWIVIKGYVSVSFGLPQGYYQIKRQSIRLDPALHYLACTLESIDI